MLRATNWGDKYHRSPPNQIFYNSRRFPVLEVLATPSKHPEFEDDQILSDGGKETSKEVQNWGVCDDNTRSFNLDETSDMGSFYAWVEFVIYNWTVLWIMYFIYLSKVVWLKGVCCIHSLIYIYIFSSLIYYLHKWKTVIIQSKKKCWNES